MASATDEMEAHLNELQKKFDRLKALYEQYFMGIEKIEPATVRKDLTRAILNLQQTHLRNTGLRFKAATLIQKWNIYQSYWNRTMRDIEAGRYVRHVATARRRAESAGLEFPAEAMGLKVPPHRPHDEPPAELPAEAAAPPRPPQGQSPAAPVPATAAPPHAPLPRPVSGTSAAVPGMSEQDIRSLHERVVSAQRDAGERNLIRYEVLVAQLSRQVPKLLSEHQCDGVAFDVVTKDGKVRLKPRPVR